ncbi:MAG: TRAP transporter small permease [Elioraea sp.]|nr:TRAP transporter small permease [Elioraea sp.]
MKIAAEERDLRPALQWAIVFDRIARLTSLGALAVSATVLLAIVALVFVSVVQRNLGGGGLDYAGELAGYGVAAVTWGGLAWALREGALIRVGLLGLVLRSYPRLDRVHHGFALLATLVMVALAAWYFWLGVERHWRRGTVSPTTAQFPMWLAEGAMLAGLLLVLFQILAMLLSLLMGHRPGAGGTIGSEASQRSSREG